MRNHTGSWHDADTKRSRNRYMAWSGLKMQANKVNSRMRFETVR
uniref:Uncharacterized protein n=1 Tax=Setaria italica TaxID=4555 RepID=K4AP72_SETIT